MEIINNDEKIRIILKVWDNYLKNQDKVNEIFWELDLFLITKSLSENLIRLKRDNFNLNNDLKILAHELHYQLQSKTNNLLVEASFPKLTTKLRALYWFDGNKLEFKVNNKDYSKNRNCHLKHIVLKDKNGNTLKDRNGNTKQVLKNGLTPENIFTRLEKYINKLKDVLNAGTIIHTLLKPDLDEEQIRQYAKYFLQSLLFDYKQNRSTLQKHLSKSLVNEAFKTLERGIKKESIKKSSGISKEASRFVNSAIEEIIADNSLDFNDFVHQIKSGQSTQQKDYAYNRRKGKSGGQFTIYPVQKGQGISPRESTLARTDSRQ